MRILRPTLPVGFFNFIAALILLLPAPALAVGGDDEPAPPITTAGPDDAVPGYETGSTQGGQEGDTSSTSEPTIPPASPGTWVRTGYACEVGGTATCHAAELCADGSVAAEWVKMQEGEVVATDPRVCPGETPGDEPTDTPRIDPAAELKKVLLPEAVIAVQPPDGETLVNLPTIFSTEAHTYTAPALEVLGQTVVFTLTPESFLWHHGDGTTQTTSTAGTRFHEGDDPTALIHHLYLETAQDLPVSVDITWSATWTLNGTAQGPVGATVTKVGTAQQLDVLEAKPTLVS